MQTIKQKTPLFLVHRGIFKYFVIKNYAHWNLNDSNTDGLFTMVNLNSFLSPYEILNQEAIKDNLGNLGWLQKTNI